MQMQMKMNEDYLIISAAVVTCLLAMLYRAEIIR